MIAGNPVETWLAALERRHLADFTASEVARALRALSSCYVERRGRLREGGALATAGKRAAFALFYAPLHFLTIREIVRALPAAGGVRRVIDLGCGTGVAGAAWALECGGAAVSGYDRHPWAVAEAAWTYRQVGLDGRAARLDVAHVKLPPQPATGLVAAYTVNELPDETRERLLATLLEARTRGARILVVEPIARRLTRWWDGWEAAVLEHGGRSDEWRFPASLPERQRMLARAAGLKPAELTAKSLFLG